MPTSTTRKFRATILQMVDNSEKEADQIIRDAQLMSKTIMPPFNRRRHKGMTVADRKRHRNNMKNIRRRLWHKIAFDNASYAIAHAVANDVLGM